MQCRKSETNGNPFLREGETGWHVEANLALAETKGVAYRTAL
jgi:hypothetical protein